MEVWSSSFLEVREFVSTFWNLRNLRLVSSIFLHLQKTTCQRFCLELLKLCTTYETCLKHGVAPSKKHWSKIKLSQKFQKIGQIMKLQTCFKNFAPSEKQKKTGERFCLELLELCKLMKFEAFCTSTKQLVRIWFGTFETLWNLWNFETLKLFVSSILHLEKKLVKDVVWNFWNFVQLMKLQSCFKHVASFFEKPLIREVLSFTSETLDNLMQLIWSILHLKKNWSEILLETYEHNMSWESRNLHTQQLNKARTRLKLPWLSQRKTSK